MLKKVPKKLLMIVGPLLLAVVLVMVVLPKFFGTGLSIQIGSAEPAATATTAGGETAAADDEHAAESEDAADEETAHETGVPFSLGDRVVNLSDPGGFRYLKVEIVLDLELEEVDAAELSGEEIAHLQEELDAELTAIKPQIQDVVTSVLTARSVADVSTVAGKEAIKAELLERLNPLLHEQEIIAVYFAQFLIQ